MSTPRQQQPNFRPPFCPNPNCLYHKHLSKQWPYKKAGHYTRIARPHRIQRFTCRHCKRSFSSQTFSTTYWQKRPELDRALFTKTTGCMSNRQIARDIAAAPETINRRLARLGRHCLLFHTQQMRKASPANKIVIDGFVSFEFSQFFPFHHHLAVEKDTDFFLYFTDSEVRRSGTMTAAQKRRREVLEKTYGRPDPQAVTKDVRELLEIVSSGQAHIQVYSDEHRAYPRAIQGLAVQVDHDVTSSRAHRGSHNPLWEVNLLDLVIRHSSANHKRETIAGSKQRQGSAERMAVLLVWRNYMKGRREKDRRSPTPAMARGMQRRALSASDVLAERLFRSRIELPPRWSQYYGRAVKTRAMPRQRRHELSYAH
jgi:transposase-like protein